MYFCENRRQSRGRRPSLCRKNELSDWVDTEEGRNAAKQLEEDMIKELARLSTQSLNLTAKERVKQESLLIQGLTEHVISFKVLLSEMHSKVSW